MTDLPTRLRAMAGQIPGTEDCYEAANYIERLEEAFRPFVTILPPQANVYDFEQNLIFEAEDIEVKIEGANPYKQWYEEAYKNIKTHKAVNTKIKNAEIPGYTESDNYHVDTPAWYGNRYGYK